MTSLPITNGHAGGGRDADRVEQALLGVGWHFPVRVDLRRPQERISLDQARGGIALARHEDDIEQAIRIVLGTQPGERRMRPTFGCRIHELVFAPISATTFGYMRRYVEEALTVWEPRIENPLDRGCRLGPGRLGRPRSVLPGEGHEGRADARLSLLHGRRGMR